MYFSLNLLFELLSSPPLRNLQLRLPAVIKILNIDAAITQGHVDTHGSVCKIGLSFDVD